MSSPARLPAHDASSPLASLGPMSFDEYFQRELEAEFKHEYRDGFMVPVGELLAMSGGSLPHSKIIHNLGRFLGNLLDGKKCQPYDSNVLIPLPHSKKSAYPDVVVFCEPPEFLEGKPNAPTNPSAVFEVLSSSTEAYDRGAKFEAYRQIPALRLYVLVSQDHPLVEVYERPEGGGTQWLYTAYARLDALAKLPALDIELPLKDVYRNVDFPPEDPLSSAMLREQEAAYAIS